MNNNLLNNVNFVGMTHLDYSKISSNFTSNMVITTSNILEGHITDAKNYNIAYTNNLRTDVDKWIGEKQESITLPVPATLTHTYITNSNLLGEIRFWVKSAKDFPVIVPAGVPDYRTMIDADGKLKIYYTFDPAINLTWGNGWIDVATQIVGLIASDTNIGLGLTGLQTEILLLNNKITEINKENAQALLEVGAFNDLDGEPSTTIYNNYLNSVNNAGRYTPTGYLGEYSSLYNQITGYIETRSSLFIAGAYNNLLTILNQNPALATFLGAGGIVFGIAVGVLQNIAYLHAVKEQLRVNIEKSSNISDPIKTELYTSNTYSTQIETIKYTSNIYKLNIAQGFINSNVGTPQTIPSIATTNITLNGTNVNNIFVSQDGGTMYNSLVFQKNTSGDPRIGFFDGPGARVIYEQSTTATDYGCSIGVNNTTKNMWFSASSNYGYEWFMNGDEIMSLSSNSQLTLNNISLTAERQYPSKFYTTSGNQTITTFLGQSAVVETITLNTTGITYGSGTYEIYSSTSFSDISFTKKLLFDYITTTANLNSHGHWSANQYSSGVYITARNKYIKPDYLGDWFVIKLPNPIILTKYRFYPRPLVVFSPSRSPGEFKFYGSMDGITFNEITQAHQLTRLITTDYSTLGYFEKVLTTDFNIPYLYIGFTVNKLVGTDNVLNFGEFQIFGKEKFAVNTGGFNGVGSNLSLLDWNNITINKPLTFPADMTNIYTKTETNTLLNTKQPNLTASTSLLGIGSNLTLINWNNITLNRPTTFPADMTNIYSKTETNTLLNAKQNNLTFQSPLINTANTITLDQSPLNNYALDLVKFVNKQYPPKPPDSFTTEVVSTLLGRTAYLTEMTINHYANGYGIGKYLVYSSSTQFNADTKEKLFDNNFTNNGVWQLSQYYSGGTYITNNNRYINVDYKGDWIVIKLPNPIILKRFRFYPKAGNAVRAPHAWKFYGSNDGLTFTEIVEASQATSLTTATDYSLGYYERILTALTTSYFYYGFTVGLLGINGYALNLAEWQLFGDAEKFLELYDNNPQYISTVVNMNLLPGSSIDCPTITQGGLSIGQVAQPYILNSTPNVQKKYMLTGTCSSSIVMPDGNTYYAYDIDLRTYTQLKYAPNPNTPYRIFKIKVFFGSVYFGYLTNNKPNVLSYEVYMSNESQAGGGAMGSAGLNVCAIGYPENVILNAISPTQLSLVCGDFNFVSVLSRINGAVFNAIIEDVLF